MGIRASLGTDAELLDKYINSSFDVIKQAVDNLDAITLFGSINSESNKNLIQLLQDLIDNAEVIVTIFENPDFIDLVSNDLKKKTYFGNRKLDIDLSLNKTGIDLDTDPEDALAIWSNTATTVYYSGYTAVFVDGTIISNNFTNDDNHPIIVSTAGTIAQQLNKVNNFTDKLINTSITEDIGGKIGSILRIIDITGTASNLDRLTLHVSSGSAINLTPIHFWANTTSALEALADRVGDIIALGNNLTQIISVSDKLATLEILYSNLTALLTVYNNLAEILAAQTHASNALISANNASASANYAQSQAISAANSASSALASLNQIKVITVASTNTGLPGTNANVVYDGTDNTFAFTIPQGFKGDAGNPYPVDAQGLLADRGTYDAEGTGFSYLAIDTGDIYFKLSNTSGHWSTGYPFGKGVGIDNISFTSTTHSSGLPAQTGGVDTYTIIYTDTTTQEINIYNGADGGVTSINGYSGVVNLTESDIPDLDKYSQTEVNNLISQTKAEAIAMSIVLGG